MLSRKQRRHKIGISMTVAMLACEAILGHSGVCASGMKYVKRRKCNHTSAYKIERRENEQASQQSLSEREPEPERRTK